jgi:polyisoprenoid-binding protein YceI
MRKNLLKRTMALALSTFLSVTFVNAQTTWKVDRSHSVVKFVVTHNVVSEVEGTFKVFDGTIKTSKEDFTDAQIDFTISVESINTNNEGRDRHLKADDMFDVAKFPNATFKSTSFKHLGGNKYELKGNLTIKDVTKPVTWEVTYGGSIQGARGKKAGFKAKTTIDRFDYNIKWNRVIEAGGLVVGKEVEVEVKLELDEVKQ